MTVVRPNSIAGINSITVQTGQALNIHDADGNLIRNIVSNTGFSTVSGLSVGSAVTAKDYGVHITGVSTCTGNINVTGTITSAGNINANGNIVGDNSTDISGINDATVSMLSISDTITHTGDTDTKIRFPSSDTFTVETASQERFLIRADGRVSIASSLNVTGVCTAAAFIPSMGQLSHRNLIINGAMAVNQYGTSSTSSGFKVIDRWSMTAEGANTTLTQSQVDVASGTAPYQLGFRKAFKILNAGQSNSNVGGDTLRIEQHIEDQIIAQSGWDYKSSSSYLTLSFWVKSSVAQAFVILLQTRSDLGASGAYTYSQNFTIGSTDTWTKITTKIPGSSSLTLDNDATRGLSVAFYMYMGGDDTSGSHTDGAWQAYNNSDLALSQTITWWTTSNSTVEYTGVQLEVGEYATPFEHRGYDNELLRCQRYYYKTLANNNIFFPGMGMADVDGNTVILNTPFPVRMRNAPSALEQTGTASDYKIRRSTTATCSSVPTFGHASLDQVATNFISASHGWGDGSAVRCMGGTTDAYLGWSAEL